MANAKLKIENRDENKKVIFAFDIRGYYLSF